MPVISLARPGIFILAGFITLREYFQTVPLLAKARTELLSNESGTSLVKVTFAGTGTGNGAIIFFPPFT